MADGIRVDDLLTADDRTGLEAAGPLDLLAGVLAPQPAPALARVVEAVVAGLSKAFASGRTAVLIVGATSGEIPEATGSPPESPAKIPVFYVARPAGSAHRGQAILSLLAAAQHARARSVGFVSGNLTSITPEWIGRLLGPVARGEAEYVAPAFTRAISEGTLTTNLLAPLTRALYGARVQEAVGECAALSGDLVERLIQADGWVPSFPGHGMDLWLLTAALASHARMQEVSLGRKTVDTGNPQPDLPSILVDLVGACFSLMEPYQQAWQEIRERTASAERGALSVLPPEASGIRSERMVRAFKLGLKDLLPVWEQILPEEVLAELYPLGLLAPEEFRFPPPVWARVVLGFALSHHERRVPRDPLLRALTPLYLGRVAAFLQEAQRTPPERLPGLLEAIDRAFEAEKEWLQARWR